MLTIFTPTYNRAYILPRLYDSLLTQTNSDFEWIVVDDGSQDNTADLLRQWSSQGKIRMRHVTQPNGGKHTAINLGVTMAHGELFFIVDSDDRLAPDAVDKVLSHWNVVRDDPRYGGMSGVRVTPDGHRIGGSFPSHILDASSLHLRTRLHVGGDLAEAWRTDLMRRFPFPVFGDERFLTEAYVWDQIACDHILRYTDEPIYICEYLPDGLTAHMTRLRHSNPIGTINYYARYTRMPVPFKEKIKGAVNFWRFAPSAHSLSFGAKASMVGLKWLGFLPLGYLFYMLDNRKSRQ